MNTAAITFSVVVVTRGRPEALATALESIAACDPPPHEVIVVDGDPAGSAKPAVDGLAAGGYACALRYLATRPSLSVQRNSGTEAASGDVIVYLDDDVELEPALFAALAAAYGDPDVVGATARVIEPARRRFGARGSRFRRLLFPGGPQGSMTSFGYPRRIIDPQRAGGVEWMQGCCMSARRAAAQRVRHDESIGAHLQGEDEDWSYRLSRLGRVLYAPEAVVHHRQLGLDEVRERGRDFSRDIVLVRAYLFRKNFRRTPVARLGFGALVCLLFAHRLVNREWAGAVGVIEGAAATLTTRGAAPLLERGGSRASDQPPAAAA